ncbi:MAG: GNAT family N-acetyltransferase, partial [Thermoplasmata archaeon]
MEIRRAGPGAESAIVEAARSFEGPFDPRAVRAYLADDRNVFLLAYEGNEVAGFLRGTELGQLGSQRKQMFLYEIEVGPRFRRHGVGAGRVRSLLQYCRERHFEEIFVLTDDPANEAARRLYLSTGAITETVADRMYVYRLDPSGGPDPTGAST